MVQHGKILVKFKSKQELLLDKDTKLRTKKPNPLQTNIQKTNSIENSQKFLNSRCSTEFSVSLLKSWHNSRDQTLESTEKLHKL